MPADLERQVRQKIVDFVTDEIDLNPFYGWIAPQIWKVARGKHPASLKKLLSKSSLYLSEYSAGQYPVQMLKNRLASLVALVGDGSSSRPGRLDVRELVRGVAGTNVIINPQIVIFYGGGHATEPASQGSHPVEFQTNTTPRRIQTSASRCRGSKSVRHRAIVAGAHG